MSNAGSEAAVRESAEMRMEQHRNNQKRAMLAAAKSNVRRHDGLYIKSEVWGKQKQAPLKQKRVGGGYGGKVKDQKNKTLSAYRNQATTKSLSKVDQKKAHHEQAWRHKRERAAKQEAAVREQAERIKKQQIASSEHQVSIDLENLSVRRKKAKEEAGHYHLEGTRSVHRRHRQGSASIPGDIESLTNPKPKANEEETQFRKTRFDNSTLPSKIAWGSEKYLERVGIKKGRTQKKYCQGIRCFY